MTATASGSGSFDVMTTSSENDRVLCTPEGLCTTARSPATTSVWLAANGTVDCNTAMVPEVFTCTMDAGGH